MTSDAQAGAVTDIPGAVMVPPPPLPGRRRNDRRNAARTASLMALLAGILNLLSAALPHERRRLLTLSRLVPGDVTARAFIVTTAAGAGLVLLSGALRRRNRLAWWATLILLMGSAVAHVAKGFDIPEALSEAFFAGYLAGQGSEFQAHLGTRDRLSLLWPSFLVVSATFVYGVVGLSLRHRPLDVPITLNDKIGDTVRMVLGLGNNLPLGMRASRFFPPSVAALFYSGAFFVILRALAPALHRRRIPAISNEEALNSNDSLAWFATRDDREVVRVDQAAVAYGVVGTVALAAGDPFGPQWAWRGVISAFWAESIRQGRIPAVIGCGAEAAERYRQSGMYVSYMGDEAVLDLDDFGVEGGARKVARQSWNRAKRAGYTATVSRARDIDPVVMAKLRTISEHWRGDAAERGFSMALGRLFDPRDADSIFAIGWDGEGKPAGFLHLVPWGTDGASLDIMRRDRHGPAIFNDFLVVEAALQLPRLGVRRLSLNFSVLRAIVAGDLVTGDRVVGDRVVGDLVVGDRAAQPGRVSLSLRVARWVLRKLSGPFQIETLYRFNKKFDPRWQPRYFAIEALEDVPRVLLAALRAEGLVSLPRRRGKGDSVDPAAEPPGDQVVAEPPA